MSGELKPGYYLLNTDAGMASSGRARAEDAPGSAAIAAVLRKPNLAAFDHLSMPIGPATHNVAEYRALIEGLKLARGHGIERIRVYMDSELVVEQMNGRAAVKHPRLRELHELAEELVAQFTSIRISWIPREMNAEADRLATMALEA